MNEIIQDNLHLLYPKYNNVNHNINTEIFRGKLYCSLLKDFSKSCLLHLNEKIFSHKKTTNRTLTNLLSSWFFTLYQYSDFNEDSFFPSNYTHFETLEQTLEDYCSIYPMEDNKDKIKLIISDLTDNYNKLLIELKSYIIINTNISIIKKIVYQERQYDSHLQNIPFYKFFIDTETYNIHFSKSIKIYNKLNNIINNIIIPVSQYNLMESRYKQCDDKISIDYIIWIILYRYQLLSSNNNQLAVLENILELMKKDYNLSCESFASAVNGSLDTFCSIYYDVEKYFGSIGSFFNIVPIKGTYSFNPPYQFDIINNGINRIMYHLNNNSELAFIITIPIWDIEGKEYMANNVTENNNNIIKYDDFNIMNVIKTSKYFKGLRMISKDNFTYFDHNFYLYKNKTIQNTYVILMSTMDITIDFINNYDFFTVK
jgi:hypothetical protein